MAEKVKVWPDWSIVRKLGEGGFGKVYEIVRSRFSIEEHRAMKVIRIPADAEDVRRTLAQGMDREAAVMYYRSLVDEFIKEIAFLSELRGAANIVIYDDYKVVEGPDGFGWKIYIMMELLTPLTDVLAEKKCSDDDVIRIGSDISDALSFCHSRNILHRDIKADNIFVNQEGVYKLGDFGIARTIEKTHDAHTRIGTGPYIAPEAFRGQSYDERADIYSLGILLYRLLNDNRSPFLPPAPQPITVTDREEAQRKRLFGEPFPKPCHGSDQLCDTILKACAFHPEDRFATAKELKNALNAKNAPRAAVKNEDEAAGYLTQRITDAEGYAYRTRPVNEPVEAVPTATRTTIDPPRMNRYETGRIDAMPPDPRQAPVRSNNTAYGEQPPVHSDAVPRNKQQSSSGISPAVAVVIVLIVLVFLGGGVTIFALLNRDASADVPVEEDVRYTAAPVTEGAVTEAPTAEEAPQEKLFYVTVSINYDFSTAVSMQVYIDGVEDEAYRESISDSGSFRFTIAASKDTDVTLSLDGSEYYRCQLDYASGQPVNEVYNDDFYSENIIG